MYRLSEEQLSEKLNKAQKIGFLDEVMIHDIKKEEKVIGRRLVFRTTIGNTKASENRFLINSIKRELRDIFRKIPKESLSSYGRAELELCFGKVEEAV